MHTLDESKVDLVRGLYAQFLRVLREKSLITPDDLTNYEAICPLFRPVYVFYDENKSFYSQLSDVQAQILGTDAGGLEPTSKKSKV